MPPPKAAPPWKSQLSPARRVPPLGARWPLGFPAPRTPASRPAAMDAHRARRPSRLRAPGDLRRVGTSLEVPLPVASFVLPASLALQLLSGAAPAVAAKPTLPPPTRPPAAFIKPAAPAYAQ